MGLVSWIFKKKYRYNCEHCPLMTDDLLIMECHNCEFIEEKNRRKSSEKAVDAAWEKNRENL